MCEKPLKKDGCTCTRSFCKSCVDPQHNSVCKRCRTPRSNLKDIPWGSWNEHGDSAILCKDCDIELKQELKDAFAESGKDTTYQGEMLCPVCGTEQSSDDAPRAFYEDGCHDYTCDYCGEDFEVNTSISYTYSTYKK